MYFQKLFRLNKFTLVITTILLFASNTFSRDISNDPGEFIRLVDIDDPETTDCSKSGGKRTYVINIHPEKMIDVSIDRYFQMVRQAGRSKIVLRANGTQPLGCNIALDAKQYWVIISSKFVSE